MSSFTIGRLKIFGGGWENCTLIFSLQARCSPIATKPPNAPTENWTPTTRLTIVRADHNTLRANGCGKRNYTFNRRLWVFSGRCPLPPAILKELVAVGEIESPFVAYETTVLTIILHGLLVPRSGVEPNLHFFRVAYLPIILPWHLGWYMGSDPI